MKHSYLILGANGQLGKQFAKELTRRSLSVSAPDEKDCDITSADSLAAALQSAKPTVVINCAAYNAVDLAEQQPGTADRINTDAVRTIAGLCADRKIRLVHYSSDYVFDGTKGDRYTEEDAVHPLNAYGRSKRGGEVAALESGADALVLRTSWVFGNGTQNFIHKMLQWSKQNPVLKLTADEVSVPTGTNDLVDLTIRAVDADLTGLFHATNSDYASRYEWGRYVAARLSLISTIIPVPMSMFPSPAQRPLFSAMSNARLTGALGMTIPDWRNAVDRFVAEYGIGV